jgi:alpha-aminoadipic semialdehyde synthase
MINVVGIKREGMDATEKRSPLTPGHVAKIIKNYNIEVVVQPSRLRIFPEEDYRAAGAQISDDLSRCNVLFGIREIPIEHIIPGAAYCIFSHTIKAQRYNMRMLRHIVEAGCTLLDYELVTNENGNRLVFQGEFAGYAGMIDSLWALGKRLDCEGTPNPFTDLKQATEYDDLSDAKQAIERAGQRIRDEGLPEQLSPFVCAFTGNGHVSKAAQEIFGGLPVVAIRPDDLPTLASSQAYSKNAVYSVVFRKSDLYKPLDPDASFDPEEFNKMPGGYREIFHEYLEYVTMIINGIDWSPRFPRLLTREHMSRLYIDHPVPRLKVVGDIACDIEGSMEFTLRSTTSDNPVYVFEPLTSRLLTGVEGEGPVVLAVDKLPAELPRAASEAFGDALLPFIPDLARADFTKTFDDLAVPEPFRKSIIAHQGQLTKNFRFLNEYLLKG